MLEDKVVVISGVGPALGTTLARRCAEAGADLVLAARTVERLDDVAKQITDIGRRAVTVGTDITDQAQVDNLVEETLKAYGKVDVLINNAFRVPSMKPLADTTFDHMRDAIELTVFGALRLIQGFTPALADAKGSVVNVNSMVVRHSQAKYGAYKMAKSALLAMSQSLATELGGAGHPGEFDSARLHLGRHAGGLLHSPGQEVRHHGRRDLRRDRRRVRPEAVADRGRGGFGDSVHGQRPVQRYHRPGARRQLRGVQSVMTPHRSGHRRGPARVGDQGVGLDDFGTDDDDYREALGVLLESYQRDADLTEIGSKMNRFFVRNALVARLMSEAAWKQYPQHADVPIERPIFVTGLPRTGTTALHRLMSADPRHQGLELWLAEFPQPRPPRETWSENPVFRELDAQFAKAHNENPDYTGPALHDRRRGRGVLAAAAAVTALGVLRDAGPPADVLAVAGGAGLDEAL